jgi:NCS1 family nucleobase:cation symporter-1
VQGLIGFVLAALFAIPFMFIHPTKIRHLFNVKSAIMPLCGLAIVCWATAANGGVSSDKLIDQSARTSTSVFAWGLVAQFNAVMGANSALLVTVPDLARYSKTPMAQVYGQALGLPLSQTICASFGIITTVSSFSIPEACYRRSDLENY